MIIAAHAPLCKRPSKARAKRGAPRRVALVRGAWRVVWLPFAFYLYTIPAVALAFCAASALAYWMFRGRGFTVPGLTVPWLTPACIVLGAFALFACL